MQQSGILNEMLQRQIRPNYQKFPAYSWWQNTYSPFETSDPFKMPENDWLKSLVNTENWLLKRRNTVSLLKM